MAAISSWSCRSLSRSLDSNSLRSVIARTILEAPIILPLAQPQRARLRRSMRGDGARRGGCRLLPALLEISRIGRWLVLARGHQVAIATDEIILRADLNMGIPLARKFRPDRLRVGVAKILLIDRPWPCERVIYYGNLVVKYVGICFVEIDALFENRLIVVVQRQARAVVDAWSFKWAPRLDYEHVIFAITILINPL